MAAKNNDVLIIFSRHVYESGQAPYIHHADILNDAQGNDKKVNFYYGVLSELIFVYDGVELTVTEPRSGRKLSSFGLVFFQKWMYLPHFALAAADYLQHENTDFMSHEVANQPVRSKLVEMVKYVYADLPYAKTVVAPSDQLVEFAQKGTLPFAFPFIVKDILGTQGQSNYLVQNVDELTDALRQSPDRHFMAQEFIPNDCDYRIVVMGGTPRYVMRRTRDAEAGGHLNNTSQGSDAEFIALDELPAHVMEEAVAAARAVNRGEYGGVDILIDPRGKHWVLEVNASPEIQTGFNAPYKSKILVDYIAERLSQN